MIRAAIACAFALSTVTIAAADEDLTATAQDLMTEFVRAIQDGPEALAPLLAPEFQIVRTDGSAYSRDDYLAEGIKEVKVNPGGFDEDFVVTRNGSIMVVRFMRHSTSTVDGKPLLSDSPRMVVFHEIDGKWKTAAYANFGMPK